MKMQKITPFLWFESNAEEAVKFYTGIFKNSSVTHTARYSEQVAKEAGRPAGSVMVMSFEIEGQKFTALNGGPGFTFNQSISFVISCDDQKELDHYWDNLSRGGKEEQCGWLKDKFGLSWQVVPAELPQLMSGPSSSKVMGALLKMKKLNIAELKAAASG